MTPASPCTAFRALPRLARINGIGLCGAIAAFSCLLWSQWRHDDDLTHGLFLPLLAGMLVAESRRDPAPRFLNPGAGLVLACALLVLASLAAFGLALTYAAALGWNYAMAEFMLATALALALGAAWLGFADRRVRFLPFNWAAAVAVVIWLFASPPPPGTYARLAFYLQTLVTDGVVRVLNGLGIAAFQDGNVIELARTSVGVSEACSGVRSLISCTVAGLFLSAILVRGIPRRVLVVAVSPAIGLAMNFLRALFLTLLANSGVHLEGRWHDLTGASILALTAVLVAAFAFWLQRREPVAVEAPPAAAPPPASNGPLQAMVAAALLLVAGATVYASADRHASRATSTRVPDLASLLPEAPQGWTVQTTAGLEQYSGILHTHALVERVYAAGPSRESIRLTLYLAYWRPGEAPVSLVDAHTPDACWPGTGWELKPVPDERASLELAGRTLAPAECRLFAHNQFETHVWFWHLYGGRPLSIVDPYSATRLLKVAWRYGFGPDEDQLFVRVSSNRPWREIASEPALRQFFANLEPLGL